MKCIAAVVMVALAAVAECGVVPVVYSAPVEKTVVQQNVAPKYVVPAPLTYAAPAVAYAAPAYSYAAHTVSHAVPAVSYVAPETRVAYSAPTFYADSDVVEAAPVAVAPAVATVVAQPAVAVVAQKEARYLAANRGAVHEAPLAGHAVNQQSLNVEPAPGTL
ncbi:cuticle protein 16.5-like [Anopheles ziemanni]|uniref:cuticle protein 16.5-like n=1 Tax=Anopheles coustani TaxID=139045 RepID=UPI00265956FE|nr:cuticle protein 16.5-like [Anopheles coustani]XP_058177478.1 cuticle protein 16.5-like [Anopheles ziemanni]